MRYKKILLDVIASVLCLGLLNGCSGYSHDFNSSEEAQGWDNSGRDKADKRLGSV